MPPNSSARATATPQGPRGRGLPPATPRHRRPSAPLQHTPPMATLPKVEASTEEGVRRADGRARDSSANLRDYQFAPSARSILESQSRPSIRMAKFERRAPPLPAWVPNATACRSHVQQRRSGTNLAEATSDDRGETWHGVAQGKDNRHASSAIAAGVTFQPLASWYGCRRCIQDTAETFRPSFARTRTLLCQGRGCSGC